MHNFDQNLSTYQLTIPKLQRIFCSIIPVYQFCQEFFNLLELSKQ